MDDKVRTTLRKTIETAVTIIRQKKFWIGQELRVPLLHSLTLC